MPYLGYRVKKGYFGVYGKMPILGYFGVFQKTPKMGILAFCDIMQNSEKWHFPKNRILVQF